MDNWCRILFQAHDLIVKRWKFNRRKFCDNSYPSLTQCVHFEILFRSAWFLQKLITNQTSSVAFQLLNVTLDIDSVDEHYLSNGSVLLNTVPDFNLILQWYLFIKIMIIIKSVLKHFILPLNNNWTTWFTEFSNLHEILK